MEISKDTKFRYTLINQHKETFQIILTLEQIEGSKNGFYEQIRNNLENNEVLKIIKREILK